VFDGRVRNGNGSDHSFMATKKRLVKAVETLRTTSHQAFRPCCVQRFDDSKSVFSENCTQAKTRNYVREFKSLLFLPIRKKKAIKPHDRLVLVR
jgi:hypothetical protein